uniref:Uncharacterized protein n=1 Tax=Tetranychus urticae TaxID=32264 RepID=T1KHM1_TETUR
MMVTVNTWSVGETINPFQILRNQF